MTPPDCGLGTGIIVIVIGIVLLIIQHFDGDTTHWN